MGTQLHLFCSVSQLLTEKTGIKPVSVSIITGTYNAMLVNNGLQLIITTPAQAIELSTSGELKSKQAISQTDTRANIALS